MNVFINCSTGNLPATGMASAVNSWYNENDNYHITTDTCDPDKVCGHYKQVVWLIYWVTFGWLMSSVKFSHILKYLNHRDLSNFQICYDISVWYINYKVYNVTTMFMFFIWFDDLMWNRSHHCPYLTLNDFSTSFFYKFISIISLFLNVQIEENHKIVNYYFTPVVNGDLILHQ